ncbi:hypothetical protein NMXN1568_2270 [Neisseria meningitidis N1568]|nr:hypothetical protein NMXN1568_2270 [Neisseria meningitidis N1568]
MLIGIPIRSPRTSPPAALLGTSDGIASRTGGTSSANGRRARLSPSDGIAIRLPTLISSTGTPISSANVAEVSRQPAKKRFLGFIFIF